MKLPHVLAGNEYSGLTVAWEDGDRVFWRGRRDGIDGHRNVLVVMPAAEHPTPGILNRLTHEFELKDDLDDSWAARPLELVRERGQTVLVLNDPGGQPLNHLIDSPMDLPAFLRVARSLSIALGHLHDRGLIHKDIKPSNIIVNAATSEVWLTGFGATSRLNRDRQMPEPPESLAGTLAYGSRADRKNEPFHRLPK